MKRSWVSGPSPLLGLAFALFAAPALAQGISSPSGGSVCSTGLTLDASPTVGVAPLVVSFNLSITGGPVGAISWEFGDGTYWSGNGSGYLAPAHRYDVVGPFTAHVSVTRGNTTGVCDVPIRVTAPALSVSASAVPDTGVAPLTVHFVGGASGGSGTLISATWEFGDGGSGSGFAVNYTYSLGGHYRAVFVVTDADGATGTAGVWVNLTSNQTVQRSPPHTPLRSVRRDSRDRRVCPAGRNDGRRFDRGRPDLRTPSDESGRVRARFARTVA